MKKVLLGCFSTIAIIAIIFVVILFVGAINKVENISALLNSGEAITAEEKITENIEKEKILEALHQCYELEANGSGDEAKVLKETVLASCVTVDAEKLAKDYDENEVNADNIYKDKYLIVSGSIEDINVMFDKINVYLKGITLYNVSLTMNDSEKDKIAELKKGDKITVIGKCDGKSLLASVNNCEILD